MNKRTILEQSFEKIKNYLNENENPAQAVVNFKTPAELKDIIDFKIPENGISEQDFLSLIDSYLNYSIKTSNKQFLNQLFSGFNFPAYIGEMFSVLANTSMYTYEVAPVATIIETEMISLMNQYSGYTEGDGIFLSGGSNANLIAMFSARNKFFPEARTEGVERSMKLRAFINEQAHYSFDNAANLLGIGVNQITKIKSDSKGRLIPSELEKEINLSLERNEIPFFVVATCGTTLLGAYDPLDEMAEICNKHNIWLHADGSFGGSIILSHKHRHLMQGIEKTDSFTWNPHKLMNIPLVCSALLVKKKGTLQHNITDINSDYIFHDIDQIEDLGKKSIQCGRSVDAVKLWFAWKYFGLKGYQQRIDHLMTMASYAEQRVRNHSQLELSSSRTSFAVCFQYLPKQVPQAHTQDINDFNLQIRESLRRSGQTLVNYGYLGDKLVIRLIISNGELESSDIDRFFDNVLEVATRLEKD